MSDTQVLPLSDLFTFVIVNSLLSAKKLTLLLLLARFPSFDQESTGSGFPVALQVNVVELSSYLRSIYKFSKTNLYLIQTKAETCFKAVC